MQNSGVAGVGAAVGSKPDKLGQSPLEGPPRGVFPSGLFLLL